MLQHACVLVPDNVIVRTCGENIQKAVYRLALPFKLAVQRACDVQHPTGINMEKTAPLSAR